MSYILEALKKAQAERQLGDTPTIHAAQPAQAQERPAAAGGRRPLLLGLGAGALVVAAGALLLWKGAAVPAANVAAANAPAANAPAANAPAAGAPAAGASTAAPAQASAPAPASAPAAVAAPAASPTLDVSAPPPPVHVAARPVEVPRAAPPDKAVAATPAPSSAPSPVSAPRTVSAPSRQAAAPSPEDSLPFLQQLPEPLRGEVPRVAFGGYMYSANPADRLLIVDKTLRHEGEEVAPGLLLEKLLPRAAVMNYRGTRYRVAY